MQCSFTEIGKHKLRKLLTGRIYSVYMLLAGAHTDKFKINTQENTPILFSRTRNFSLYFDVYYPLQNLLRVQSMISVNGYYISVFYELIFNCCTNKYIFLKITVTWTNIW